MAGIPGNKRSTPRKPVWLSPQVHALLAALAAEDQRTLVAEVAWLIARERARRAAALQLPPLSGWPEAPGAPERAGPVSE